MTKKERNTSSRKRWEKEMRKSHQTKKLKHEKTKPKLKIKTSRKSGQERDEERKQVQKEKMKEQTNPHENC